MDRINAFQTFHFSPFYKFFMHMFYFKIRKLKKKIFFHSRNVILIQTGKNMIEDFLHPVFLPDPSVSKQLLENEEKLTFALAFSYFFPQAKSICCANIWHTTRGSFRTVAVGQWKKSPRFFLSSFFLFLYLVIQKSVTP